MIVDELAACLQSPSIIEGGKRAAVGIVLRRPEGSGDGALSPTDIGTVNVKDLEVLFILRAINENDRWSGQVGLPGGRQDPGETDLETATREVYEEVGLVLDGIDKTRFPGLDDSNFKLLGRIRDRSILPGKDKLVISSFVFIQTSPRTPPFFLDAFEVAACGWTRLSVLLEDKPEVVPVVFNLRKSVLREKLPNVYKMIYAVGLDRLNFTGVKLEMEQLHSSGNIDGITGEALSHSIQPIDPTKDVEIRDAFLCWGSTLGIINDLLTEETGLRQHRICLISSIAPHVYVEKMYPSHVHSWGLAAMRRSYALVYGTAMPYDLYIKAYPLFVLSLAVTSTGYTLKRLLSKL